MVISSCFFEIHEYSVFKESRLLMFPLVITAASNFMWPYNDRVSWDGANFSQKSSKSSLVREHVISDWNGEIRIAQSCTLEYTCNEQKSLRISCT